MKITKNMYNFQLVDMLGRPNLETFETEADSIEEAYGKLCFSSQMNRCAQVVGVYVIDSKMKTATPAEFPRHLAGPGAIFWELWEQIAGAEEWDETYHINGDDGDLEVKAIKHALQPKAGTVTLEKKAEELKKGFILVNVFGEPVKIKVSDIPKGKNGQPLKDVGQWQSLIPGVIGPEEGGGKKLYYICRALDQVSTYFHSKGIFKARTALSNFEDYTYDNIIDCVITIAILEDKFDGKF